jgi:hypothetical protein
MINENIWEESELLAEWDHEGLRYKAFSVPRDALDEDFEESDALYVVGLDSGNVRRYEELFDPAFDRMTSGDKILLKAIFHQSTSEVRDFILNEMNIKIMI